jgi:hypothetical protein
MIRLRQASMIAVLSLLTSAATASAECAWVLWSNFFMEKIRGTVRQAIDRASLSHGSRSGVGSRARSTREYRFVRSPD